MICLDMSSPNLLPRHNIISHIVYAASGFNVSDVVINGKMVMHERRFMEIDEEKLNEEVERAKEELVDGLQE